MSVLGRVLTVPLLAVWLLVGGAAANGAVDPCEGATGAALKLCRSSGGNGGTGYSVNPGGYVPGSSSAQPAALWGWDWLQGFTLDRAAASYSHAFEKLQGARKVIWDTPLFFTLYGVCLGLGVLLAVLLSALNIRDWGRLSLGEAVYRQSTPAVYVVVGALFPGASWVLHQFGDVLVDILADATGDTFSNAADMLAHSEGEVTGGPDPLVVGFVLYLLASLLSLLAYMLEGLYIVVVFMGTIALLGLVRENDAGHVRRFLSFWVWTATVPVAVGAVLGLSAVLLSAGGPERGLMALAFVTLALGTPILFYSMIPGSSHITSGVKMLGRGVARVGK